MKISSRMKNKDILLLNSSAKHLAFKFKDTQEFLTLKMIYNIQLQKYFPHGVDFFPACVIKKNSITVFNKFNFYFHGKNNCQQFI